MLEDEVVRVIHSLKNTGGKPLEVTPWALSVMAPGGTAHIPQPRLDFHPSEFPEGRSTKPQDFLPNRELILWPFTNITDGRYAFSEHFLRVSHHPERPATKIGLKLATGWIAYQNGDFVFAKHFVYDPFLTYPDMGANFELFTNIKIMELESLAPSLPLPPGATREHVEHWVLRPELHRTTSAATKKLANRNSLMPCRRLGVPYNRQESKQQIFTVPLGNGACVELIPPQAWAGQEAEPYYPLTRPGGPAV